MVNSKTPQFDKAIDEILSPLIPHERMCRKCNVVFKIEEEDINFFHMLRVPPPTLCPQCRQKRRLGHLMRVPKFYKKKCSAPGHIEEVISVFPPDSPHKIYDFSYYHSDAWDGTQYTIDYNSTLSFFSQFKDFFFSIPRLCLERDPQGVNCDYSLGGKHSKNVYYAGMGYEMENCSYCFDTRHSKDIVDSGLIRNSEFCYWCVSSSRCNRCIFAINCENCIDSSFIYDCKNCSHCFLSSNLRNKSYVFDNKQLTKEEYEKKMQEVNTGNRDVFNSCERQFDEIISQALQRSVYNVNAINSIGDNLFETKNCSFVFRIDRCENLRFSANHEQVRDSLDTINSITSEKLYETAVILGGNAKFCMYLRDCSFMEYCIECYHCNDCFGCVGLKNKKFHIFNKPYSEEEYWKKVDEIKTPMLARGEYGEFFDLSFGFMPYQSSTGQYYCSLTEEEAKKENIPWYPEPESSIPQGMKIRDPYTEVPANIEDVTDEILKDGILCETSKRPFRIIESELQFYKQMHIPIPTKSPWERMIARKKYERPLALYDFSCPKCGEKSFSIYTPEEQKKLKIFCEKCYLREVV